jgi:[acyl-carrier-protein] S-malonyltransferase
MALFRGARALTLAMVFPGQGSQSTGMLAALAEQHAEIRATFTEAGDILGYDLWNLVQNGPAARLDETVVTQPAMLTAGVATWRAWRSAGGDSAAAMAGHSLGEYTALVCAGALPFANAVQLVTRRAELMQAAVPAGKGAMAAILGLDDDAVIEACRQAAKGQVVSAVNFNSPGQVVIAGERGAVERAAELAKAAGAKRALLLSVSVPSHCELMRPAAGKLAAALAGTPLSTPSIPVIGNADVRPYEDAEQIRVGLAKQLHSPVRWTETVRDLINRGNSSIVECGPGKVLTGLTKRIDRSIPAICIDTRETMTTALAEHAVGSQGSNRSFPDGQSALQSSD